MNQKRRMYLSALVVLVASFAALGQPSAADATALMVVMDTSWSCDRDMRNFRALARQAISGLEPGDYFEIITADSQTPQLRRGQTVKTGGSKEIEAVAKLLDSITGVFLSNARVSRAVEMAFKRLDKIRAQGAYRRGAVIVFGDGKLADRDAKDVLSMLQRRGEKGWPPLYMTGSRSCNKSVLVAANDGVLSFALIKESNPTLWLQGLELIDKQEAKHSMAPESMDVATQQDLPDTGDNLPVLQGPLTDVMGEPPADSNEELLAGKEPAGPEVVGAPPMETPATEPADKPSGRHWSLRSWAGRILRWSWWMVLPVVAIAAAVIAMLLRATAKARKWSSHVSTPSKAPQKKDPGILVAKFNGQSYSLGRPDRLGAIHIGSGAENTVRIQDKTIAARHAKIFRRGTDLVLKNLGHSPISVNGTALKSRGQQRLTIPSVLQFNDSVKLNLALSRPQTDSKKNGRNEHEDQAK